MLTSIRYTRKEAQTDIAETVRVPWKFLRAKCGYRCVKVWMSYRENAGAVAPPPQMPDSTNDAPGG